jgi:hypothetical protein
MSEEQNESQEECEEVYQGKRIKFIRDGKNLFSHKIFTDGDKIVRVVINTEEVTFKLIDPVMGYTHVSGGEGITNLEVLQRHVKKALKDLLGVKFEKEKRKVNV